ARFPGIVSQADRPVPRTGEARDDGRSAHVARRPSAAAGGGGGGGGLPGRRPRRGRARGGGPPAGGAAGARPPRPGHPRRPAPGPGRWDCTTRVVAYVHGSQPVTRQDLGEYLIARFGADKLPLLLNKRIVDEACRQRNIVVTAAEVEAAFAEDLKGLAVDKA